MKFLKMMSLLSAAFACALTAEAVNPTLRILPLGDSLTWGTGSEGTRGYRKPLWDKLVAAGYNVDFVGSQDSLGMPVIDGFDENHEGHGGWVIDGAATQAILPNLGKWASAATSLDPHVVLVHVGTNEANYDNARQKYQDLLEKLRILQPSAKVIATTLLPRKDYAGKTGTVEADFNPYVEGIVAAQKDKGQDICYLDVHGIVDTATDYSDIVHLNAGGYAKFAQAWFEKIREIVPNPASFATENQITVVYETDVGAKTGPRHNVFFNREMDKATVESIANWSFSGNITTPSVTLDATGRKAVLAFGAADALKTVTVSASGLKSATGLTTGAVSSHAVTLAEATGGDNVWTGAGKAGDWNDPDNWSAGNPPQADEKCYFNDSVTITSAFKLPGPLTVVIAANKTVEFGGVISGDAGCSLTVGDYVLDASGIGTAKFMTDNTYAGDFYLENGAVLTGADAVTPFGDEGSAYKVLVWSRNTDTYLGISGLNMTKKILVKGVDTNPLRVLRFQRAYREQKIGALVWNGLCRVLVSFGDEKVLWTGGNAGSSGGFAIGFEHAGGEICVTNTPITICPVNDGAYDANGVFSFACTGNRVQCGKNFYHANFGCKVRCDVDNCFTSDSELYFTGTGKLDLNGTRQQVAKFYGSGEIALPDGTYVAPGQSGGTVCDLLTGAGVLTVGAVAPVVNPTIRIMPLGDSITAGTGSTDGNGYRTPLWTKLKEAGYNVDYVGNQTGASSASLGDRDHEGHGGWYLSNPEKGLLEHLDEWFSTIGDPHLVLLLAGTNDTGDGEEGFRNNATNKLVQVLERIRLDQPSAKVVVGTCLNRKNGTRNAWLRDYYNPYVPGIVSAQAAKGQAVTYVDFFGTLDEAADFADEVHPNDAGYEKIAQKWFAAIRAAFPDPSSFATENDLAVVRAASAATASGVECRLTFNRRMSKAGVENAGKWTFVGNATAPTVALSADARTAVLTFGADDRSKTVTIEASGLANETETKTVGFTRDVELAAAPGVVKTWIGSSSGDWNVASNWDGGVPAANDVASFGKDVRISSAVALSGNLSIWVKTDCALDLDGVVSGPAGADLVIGSESDAGTVNFNASNTFKGSVRLVNGYARAKADNAFGDPASGEVSVTAANRTTRLYFDGVTSLKPLVQNNVDDGKVSQDFVRFEGVNTIGRWTWNGICRSLLLDGNTRVWWTGGNEGANDLFIPCVFGANGELVVRDRPISGFPYYEANSKGKFVFAVAGNAIVCDVALGMTLRTDVDGAFAANSVIRLNANGKLDLNGHDQCVAAFYGSDGQPYPDGVYVAEGQTGGTVNPQLVGAGRLTVGAPPPVENAWIGNGEPGNWNDPDNWTVGVPKAGARLTFPQAKVTITSPVVLPGDVTIAVPATGAWTYGELDFEGVISGDEGDDITIDNGTEDPNWKYGQVHFKASNTFRGSVIIKSGRVHADADNAFGDAAYGAVDLRGNENYAVVQFNGVTSLKRLVTDGTKANNQFVQFCGAANVIGRWDRVGTARFGVGTENNVTHWMGGGTGDGEFIPALYAAGGTLVVSGSPVDLTLGWNDAWDTSLSQGAIAFACTGNRLRTGSHSANVQIRCDVADCFVAESELMLNMSYGGKLNLNGTNQRLAALTVDAQKVEDGLYVAEGQTGGTVLGCLIGSGRLTVGDYAPGEVVVSDSSLPARLDTRDFTDPSEPVEIAAFESLLPIAYSADNWGETAQGLVQVSAVVGERGVVSLVESTGAGEVAFALAAPGRWKLTHQAGGKTLTAYFLMPDDLKTTIDTDGDQAPDTQVSAYGGADWLVDAPHADALAFDSLRCEGKVWTMTLAPVLKGGSSDLFTRWFELTTFNGLLKLRHAANVVDLKVSEPYAPSQVSADPVTRTITVTETVEADAVSGFWEANVR